MVAAARRGGVLGVVGVGMFALAALGVADEHRFLSNTREIGGSETGGREGHRPGARPTDPVRGAREAPVTAVSVDGGFWADRQKINRDVTAWYVFEQCEKTGRIENLRAAGEAIAGKPRPGYKFQGLFFNDSDVHKAIEGAADILAAEKAAGRQNSESWKKLDAYLDDLIAVIARAQEPDGYLNSYFTLAEPTQKWANLKDKHELYCGGHLIEAGVAHHRATGKRALLDVAIRFADCVNARFGRGPGQLIGVCGHEEIELALVKLWRETGEEKYLKLAQFFIEERGRTNGPADSTGKPRSLYGEYAQDEGPVEDHREVVGHAVRAMYLYCATADLARYTGDERYDAAMGHVWSDLTFRKTYVTGGIGPSAHNEGFTIPYDLPNDTAYAETCAGIGSVMWNHRLALLRGDSRHVDAMERALYNGVLSGVSLSGDRFFYVNPLMTGGGVKRREWFDCACCPPNILRMIGGIGGYAYAWSPGAVCVNLYMDSTARVPLVTGDVVVRQRTGYPWNGRVDLEITGAEARPSGGSVGKFELRLRVPEWAGAVKVELNGSEVGDGGGAGVEEIAAQHGYVVLAREWRSGDKVALTMAMPVERLEANPAVKTNAGRVALRRGPVVYCVEGVDNSGSVADLVVPRDAAITMEQWGASDRGGLAERPEKRGGDERGQARSPELAGMTVLRIQGLRERGEEEWDHELYRTASGGDRVTVTAVPYFAWDNRGDQGMMVWAPESGALLGRGPVKWIKKATVSQCWAGDRPGAMCDGREPTKSSDESLPRMTWWDHQGTSEWAQYDFDKPRKVTGVEVYWFDDTGKGGCRVPASWKVMYKDGQEWKPVKMKVDGAKGEPGTEKDKFNAVSFDEVRTDGLRLEVELQKGYSGGILEWKVVEVK